MGENDNIALFKAILRNILIVKYFLTIHLDR